MPREIPTTVIALLVLATACGNDEGGLDEGGSTAPDAMTCVDPAGVELPEGLFSRPSDFDRASCTPGSLAGFDPTGLWYAVSPEQRKFGTGPVRFTSSCEDGITTYISGTASAAAADVTLKTDDDIFFRRARDFDTFSYFDSFDLCGVDGDGNPTGRTVRCFIGDFGESCSEREITLEPFGRLPGESEADGLELVSEWSGPADAPWPEAFTANVAYHDGIAYVARGSDAVRIVDVSDPSSPKDLGSFPSESDNYNDLAVVPAGDKIYLLVASAVFGAIVLDVTDPTSPTQVTRFEAQEGAGVHRLFVDDIGGQKRAYLADGGSTLIAWFDVTDPTNPTRLGEYDTGDQDWGVHAVFARGDRIYVNATVGGLVVVDASSDPVEDGRYVRDGTYSHASMPAVVGGRKIVLHGDEGYDSPLEVIDDDPTSQTYMEKIGELVLRKEVSIHNFVVVGDKAYVAHYQDGVRIVDLSDPTSPAQLAYFNTWSPETAPGGLLEGTVDLEVDGDLVYVAETPRGLLILREK